MPTVFLVMATSGQFEPPIPVRVFREREHAEAYQAEVIEMRCFSAVEQYKKDMRERAREMQNEGDI